MEHFPDRQIHLTNQIIHNPKVNGDLKSMNVEIMENEGGEKDFSSVNDGDVVVFPAFGASFEEMDYLSKRVS